MRGSVTLAYSSSLRQPGQRLPGGTGHICPVNSLGSVLDYIQWSSERVDAWAVVATRRVLVRIAAPVRPRCHSAGGVPRPGRGSPGGTRVPSGFRRAALFSACRDWWRTGACLGRSRCTPLERGAAGRPARTCACSCWRPILDVCAGRHSAAGAGGGANSPVSSGARQLHSGPRQGRPRCPSRGFGPGSVGVIPRASRAAAQPCGRRPQGAVGLPRASRGWPRSDAGGMRQVQQADVSCGRPLSGGGVCSDYSDDCAAPGGPKFFNLTGPSRFSSRESPTQPNPPPPQACPHQEGQGPPPLLHLAGQGPLPYARWKGQGQGKGHSSLPY